MPKQPRRDQAEVVLKPRRLLRYSDLKGRGLHWSRTHLYRLEAANRFPRRVQIGMHFIGWVEDEVDKHIADLIRARDEILQLGR
jgi:predicted DNA-binding transcriptional regulator AlpA